jgi:hypothetical protein
MQADEDYIKRVTMKRCTAVLMVLMLFLVACAQRDNPEDIIPTNVRGFNFALKSAHIEASYTGEEYSTYGLFKPMPTSEFQDKVDCLVINVHRFKDETSAGEFLSMAVRQAMTPTEEIQVGDIKTILRYNEEKAETCILWQQRKLVILSCSYGPYDPDTGKMTIPDEQALKNAAIEGARATIQSTYS